MKLTKTVVDRLPNPETGYALHWDDQLPGFGVRVTHSGIKSYVLQRRVGTKERRITLGRHGVLTCEQARKEAMRIAGDMTLGRDPILERRRQRLQAVTLGETFEAYIQARKSLKPRTVEDLRQVLRTHLADWQSRPVASLTPEDIEKKHQAIGETSHSRANVAMRYLRAVLAFAMERYRDDHGRPVLDENPVQRLSRTRAWFPETRRRSVIKPHQLRPWVAAVQQLESETARDFLLMLLLTGLRRREAARLTWPQVDLEGRTLTVVETKNGRPHTLPLSDDLVELFGKRKARAGDNAYVFPSADGTGHYSEPKGAMERVTRLSGVPFMLHDLRRTFITVAESLDISAYAVKALVNHSTGNDVTSGYVVLDVERLLPAMERITDHILRLAGLSGNAEVVEFAKRR